MQEIIIAKQEDRKQIAIVENGKLQEFYEEKQENVRKEGNIYLGRVKDILPGMQAAFIDIGEEKTAFLHLKDILPKKSEITGNKEEDLSKYRISDYIKVGEPILVQIKKDETSNKGARVSTNIHITGRLSVFMPENRFITISQKIEEQTERERLKKIGKEILDKTGTGTIIRTVAKGKSKQEIEIDIKENIKRWNEIVKLKEQASRIPMVIYECNSIIEKLLVDLIDTKLERILVEDNEIANQVKENIKLLGENISIPVIVKEEIKNLYDLQEQIEKLASRKIWLKCGGFITIDKTEALTAIDVNSGKYTGEKELAKTIVKVNEEASIEIAKQLRLRDIGGIIIIDYIDMIRQEDKDKVVETLKEALKKDRAKTQIMEFTKLNLLEMTRKHIFSN